jgi:hypothetical protein
MDDSPYTEEQQAERAGQALAQLDLLKLNRDFMSAYWAGDKAAFRIWTTLHEIAYGKTPLPRIGGNNLDIEIKASSEKL